jgi:hypothetical protein
MPGRGAFNRDVASFTIASLAVGSQAIAVLYSSDTNFKMNTMAILN